jgi:hypothetical protein
MDPKEIGCEIVDWINLVHWREIVYTAIKIWAGKFLDQLSGYQVAKKDRSL